MGYARTSQQQTGSGAATEAPAGRTSEAPGVEAWGNAAAAEQIPSTRGEGAHEGGEPGPAPWWAGGEEEGEMSAMGAFADFRAEIAKPDPDAVTVLRLLLTMTEPNLRRIRDEPETWAEITALLSPAQLKRVDTRATVMPADAAFYIQNDRGVLAAREQLRARVKELVDADVLALLTALQGVDGPTRHPPTVIPPNTVDATLSAETAALLGTSEVTVRMRYDGPLNPAITPAGAFLEFSAGPAAELVFTHPTFGTLRRPESLRIPSFSALFVLGRHVMGSPDAQW